MGPDVVIPTRAEALRVWWRIGLVSVGGPAAQIGLLHDEVVARRRWVSEEQFQAGLSFATLLPGPEAQQLATYLGYRILGIRGALVAGTLFVLPGATVLMALSTLAVLFGSAGLLGGMFWGLRAVVVAIVAQALWRLSRRMLRTPLAWVLAVAGLTGSLMGVWFPAMVALAAAAGAALGRDVSGHGGDAPPAWTPGPTWRAAGVLAAAWWLPVVTAGLIWGPGHVLFQVGLFFSLAAMVTFGGAYAVLAFVHQQATGPLGWLTPEQMATGLALAESTPGPLILVLQHVGYMAGWNAADAGTTGRLGVAVACAVMASWATFVPSLVWIVAGVPYVERGLRVAWLRRAMGGVSGCVVGVVAALGVVMAGAATMPGGRPDYAAALLALGAAVGLFSGRVGLLGVIAIAAGLGLVAGGLGWHVG